MAAMGREKAIQSMAWQERSAHIVGMATTRPSGSVNPVKFVQVRECAGQPTS
jgi:hypothetical protein